MLFRSAGRASPVGFPFEKSPKSLKETSEEEREAFLEELWGGGGFQFLIRNFNDVMIDKDSNRVVYDFWKRYV